MAVNLLYFPKQLVDFFVLRQLGSLFGQLLATQTLTTRLERRGRRPALDQGPGGVSPGGRWLQQSHLGHPLCDLFSRCIALANFEDGIFLHARRGKEKQGKAKRGNEEASFEHGVTVGKGKTVAHLRVGCARVPTSSFASGKSLLRPKLNQLRWSEYDLPMTKTEKILALERAHVWPPYTQAVAYFASPHPVIERGEGVFLYDTAGNRYYDMISSWWVNLHGHGHPRLTRALAEQAAKLQHCALAGWTHEPAVKLAAALVRIAPPGLTRVFFSDDGSTAVEVALKMAFQYFQNRGENRRTKFAAFTSAYHGDTLGAVAVGGIDLFHAIYRPTLVPVVRAPAPTCAACPYGKRRETCAGECFEGIAAALRPHVDELCAIIIEPLVQGAAGMRMYSPAILRSLRAFCDAQGILLIDDEVAMAFGRTGRIWACEHADVVPDILCAAKGLTGGYLPLAVTLAREAIYEAFLGQPGDTKTFYHGHSFTGNPLAAAVAIESLALLGDECMPKLPERIAAMGQMLERFRRVRWAADVRQFGMVAAFDLCGPNGEALDPALGSGRRVGAAALRHGVYLRPLGDTIYFMPPLSMTPDELADLGDRVFAACEEALAVR